MAAQHRRGLPHVLEFEDSLPVVRMAHQAVQRVIRSRDAAWAAKRTKIGALLRAG